MSLLNVQAVSHRYGPKLALDQVSFALDAGIVGLLGPNGAGKSSLMRILATLTRPSAGTATWRGQDIHRRPQALRAELGYLPQDFGVYENLSALEFLNYLAAVKGLRGAHGRARVEWVLLQTGLQDVAGRRLGGYSGGMRQRVGIAQALLNDPALLIVDEPTVGLDPGERMRFRHMLSELAGERLVLLSTHIVADLEVSAERLLVLDGGRLKYSGSMEDLLEAARGQVWEWLVEEGALKSLRAQLCLSQSTKAGKDIRVRAISAECPAVGAQAVAPTLEDAYMNLLRT